MQLLAIEFRDKTQAMADRAKKILPQRFIERSAEELFGGHFFVENLL